MIPTRRPTLISRQTPTELPRACRLEVTTLHIERDPDGTVFFRDRPHMVPLVTQKRRTILPPPPARAPVAARASTVLVVLAFVALAVVALSGCAGAEEDTDRCVFGGRYDIGVDWSEPGYRPECGLFARSLTANGEEDECIYSGRELTVAGDLVQLTISCEAGDPVIECAGYADSSSGCSWPVYIRRIVP